MERALARAVPHLRNAPRGEVRRLRSVSSNRQPANLRLALILLSVAGVFFLGIVLKFIFFPTH